MASEFGHVWNGEHSNANHSWDVLRITCGFGIYLYKYVWHIHAKYFKALS